MEKHKHATKRRKIDDDAEEVTREEEDTHAPTDVAREEQEEPLVSDGKYRNKQRCLTVSSRGVPARFRHLMEDLRSLMPHHKKESKLDPGPEGMAQAVNDITEIRGCNSVLFLECRKRQDCYMWMGRTGADAKGPSARFLVSNVHTMDELRLTGNCMKGSRPILCFDDCFEKFGHLQLLKELFIDIFGTPRGHPKAKPFVDRVMSFYFADNRVSPSIDCNSQGMRTSLIKNMMSVCLRDFSMRIHII